MSNFVIYNTNEEVIATVDSKWEVVETMSDLAAEIEEWLTEGDPIEDEDVAQAWREWPSAWAEIGFNPVCGLEVWDEGYYEDYDRLEVILSRLGW